MPAVEGSGVAEEHSWDREATHGVLEGSNAGGNGGTKTSPPTRQRYLEIKDDARLPASLDLGDSDLVIGRCLVSRADAARRVGGNQHRVWLARVQSVCQQFARHRTAPKA